MIVFLLGGITICCGCAVFCFLVFFLRGGGVGVTNQVSISQFGFCYLFSCRGLLIPGGH